LADGGRINMANLVINKNTYDALGEVADKHGKTRTTVATELLADVGLGNKDVRSIVLQVPRELTSSNEEALKVWLDCRTKVILNLFYPRGV
jgi:hypothetical protein